MKQSSLRLVACAFVMVASSLVGLSTPAMAGKGEGVDPGIVVTAKGVGVLVEVEGVPGLCFEGELFSTPTGVQIGTSIDCIDIVDTDGANFSVNRTTIFKFPQGELVTNGLTTAVAVFGDSSPGNTHMVGDVDSSTQNIVSGTKRFKGRTGDVRLSGAVNLSDFPNTVGFNCLFVIHLD